MSSEGFEPVEAATDDRARQLDQERAQRRGQRAKRASGGTVLDRPPCLRDGVAILKTIALDDQSIHIRALSRRALRCPSQERGRGRGTENVRERVPQHCEKVGRGRSLSRAFRRCQGINTPSVWAVAATHRHRLSQASLYMSWHSWGLACTSTANSTAAAVC